MKPLTKTALGVFLAALIALVAAFSQEYLDDDTATPPTSTTVEATTTTEAPATTTTEATTTTTTAADVDVAAWLTERPIPESTAWEPSGNFRTFCRPTHLGHDDPIVHPGEPGASHLHQFFGNPDVDASSTYASLRAGTTSTCEGGPLNLTGYWVPAMFAGDDVVPPDFVLVYYKGNGSGADAADMIRAIEPYPDGLRMVAGAPAGHATWKCEGGSGQGSTIPSSCPDGEHLIGIVDFPSCWDGRNLDSPDHRSHMSYPVRDGHTGINACPSTHPHHLPELTELIYYPGAADLGTWTLSSDAGAPRGSTLHADWFGAWHPDILDRWVTSCIHGLRNGNNGNLCDGHGLTPLAGGMSTDRVPGWTPTAP